MKKEEYILLLQKIAAGTCEESKPAYLALNDAATSDFCPPFDRENLLLLAFDLYAISLVPETKVRVQKQLSAAIASLSDIGTKEYRLPDFATLAEEAVKNGHRNSATTYLIFSAIRSLILLIGNRL